MSSSGDEIKKAIVGVLETCGSASPMEIALALGEEWQKAAKRVLLRQMLRRLVKQHVLHNPFHGVYALSPDYKERGVSGKHATENDIHRFLTAQGGVATTTEIHQHLWGRERGNNDRSYDRKRITVALSESDRFQHDFGRGVWNLPTDELEQLPLLGRWASRRIRRHFDPVWSIYYTWMDHRDEWFRDVGAAFETARGSLSIDKVSADPAVRDGLMQMAPPGSVALANALDDLRDMVRAEGVPSDLGFGEAVRARNETELPQILLEAFEAGDVNLHLAAPIEFYTACAMAYGVCPAKLSRGVVEKLLVEA